MKWLVLMALFFGCSDSTSVEDELKPYVDELTELGVDFSGIDVVVKDIDGINGRCSRAGAFGNDTIIINLRQMKSTPDRSIQLTLLHEAIHCVADFRGHLPSAYFSDGCKAVVMSVGDPNHTASHQCWETHKTEYVAQYFKHLGE